MWGTAPPCLSWIGVIIRIPEPRTFFRFLKPRWKVMAGAHGVSPMHPRHIEDPTLASRRSFSMERLTALQQCIGQIPEVSRCSELCNLLLAALALRSERRSPALEAAGLKLTAKFESPIEIARITGMYQTLLRAGKAEKIRDYASMLPVIVGEPLYQALTDVERDELGTRYLESVEPILGMIRV